jgi:hypothetical protein
MTQNDTKNKDVNAHSEFGSRLPDRFWEYQPETLERNSAEGTHPSNAELADDRTMHN